MTSPGLGDFLRRDDVISGSIQSQRRGARVLGTIEARVFHMREETRRAIDVYFFGGGDEYERKVDRGYLASVLARTRADTEVSLRDFDRFAAQWRSLVPGDPRVRAEVIQRLRTRFGQTVDSAYPTLEALGANSLPVLEAYAEAFGERLTLSEFGTAGPASASADPQESATWRRIAGGEEIYGDGDAANALYLVVNGHLLLKRNSGNATEVEWEYGRGDVVGEAEVLTGETRSGTLMAQRDSEIISVPKESILALARERPEVLLRLNRALANRLRGQSAESARRDARTFAVLPAHPGAPVSAVALALVEALKRLGSVAHVDRRGLDNHLPEGPGLDSEAYEAEIIAWLSEKETENDFVVAEAESDPDSDWSLRCLRQGDRDVLVADARATPDAALLQRIADQSPEPLELVLVHPANAKRPKNTRTWLRAGKVSGVYHWPLGHVEQAAHIARRLTGNGVAVVLSGGAARGYAHIGAMKALIERGIPIDLIAGTSMGALVGAGFALGRDAPTMRENALATAGRRKLLDPTLPFTAFTSGAKVTRLLKRETEGERIEDLWRPYFCISSNLTRANAQVHSQGALWHAIRASIAIPGIFPPVLAANGDVLVDGSSINNMPIDLARERNDIGLVIAVNVAPSRDRVEAYRFGPSVSGWKTLVRRMGGRKDSRAPGLFSTVMRANEIRGAALMKSSSFTSLADLIIEPPVAEFASLQFKLCPEIIDCGYAAAVQALDAWMAGQGSGILEDLGVVGSTT